MSHELECQQIVNLWNFLLSTTRSPPAISASPQPRRSRAPNPEVHAIYGSLVGVLRNADGTVITMATLREPTTIEGFTIRSGRDNISTAALHKASSESNTYQERLTEG